MAFEPIRFDSIRFDSARIGWVQFSLRAERAAAGSLLGRIRRHQRAVRLHRPARVLRLTWGEQHADVEEEEEDLGATTRKGPPTKQHQRQLWKLEWLLKV